MKLAYKYASMMVAALLLGFSSCTKEDVTDITPNLDEGKPASLNLTLVDNGNKNAITYSDNAKPSGNTHAATGAESNIGDLMIYIFDKDGKLEYADSEKTGIELASGPKTVYMIGNQIPTFSTFSATVGDANATEENLLKEKMDVSEIGDIATDSEFYIMNIGGAGAINIAPGVNNMSLSVGRGAAMVNIDMTNALNPSTGTLSGFKYLIANNPTEMFCMPNYVEGQLQTPFFNDEAAEGYFDNGEISENGTSIELKEANGDVANRSYAVENAITSASVSFNTISYAIIQGSFAPSAVVNVNGDALTYSKGHDFWRIQYVLTKKISDQPEEYEDVEELGYYTAFVVGEAPVAGNAVYESAKTNAPSTSVEGGEVDIRVVKYKGDGSYGAYCYYFLGLGDTNITDESKKTERFTVERNKYYYYEVTSVSDCGSATVSPNENVEPSMSSTLNVNFVDVPWGVVVGLNPGI